MQKTETVASFDVPARWNMEIKIIPYNGQVVAKICDDPNKVVGEDMAYFYYLANEFQRQ